MAVESRFVVIRQGVEVETFMDKKAADDYDKMLDMADNLAEIFARAPVELAEEIREELGVYLAQNRDNVLVALQAKKAKVKSNKADAAEAGSSKTEDIDAEKSIKKESKVKTSGSKVAVKKSATKSKTATA